MKRWYWILITWYLSLPAWARLGGGSSYRSSSSSSYSSGSSSWSSGSSSSWSSGSSSSYSGGSYSGGGEFSFTIFFLFLLILGGLAYIFIKATKHQQGGGGIPKSFLVGGGLILLLFLMINPPLLAVVALALLSKGGQQEGGVLGTLRRFTALTSGGYQGSSSSPSGPRAVMKPPVYAEILQTDPNFSMPVFREFAVLLYCQALQEMPGGNFRHTVPYLSPSAVKQLTQRGASMDRVRDVVVGSFAVTSAGNGYKTARISVKFDSNYIVDRGGKQTAYMSQETWVLERKQGLLSKPPRPVSVLKCPSCGYGGDFPANGVCPQCQSTNVRADYDWLVTNVSVLLSEEFEPHFAEGGGVEEGTNLPTLVHGDLARRKEDFLTRHPDFQWTEFFEYASKVFMKLQTAWSERDPSKCRPHETDLLFRTHRYWIEDYQRRNKINKLSDITIEGWELSNIVMDAFYESITARVRASMIDVTTDETGRVLYGDSRRPRRFTEYWTFIRRIGNEEPKGDSLQSCPSCGAPLDRINQTGECEYCQTVVTLGDFGWVLSNIEQDEVYEPV